MIGIFVTVSHDTVLPAISPSGRTWLFEANSRRRGAGGCVDRRGQGAAWDSGFKEKTQGPLWRKRKQIGDAVAIDGQRRVTVGNTGWCTVSTSKKLGGCLSERYKLRFSHKTLQAHLTTLVAMNLGKTGAPRALEKTPSLQQQDKQRSPNHFFPCRSNWDAGKTGFAQGSCQLVHFTISTPSAQLKLEAEASSEPLNKVNDNIIEMGRGRGPGPYPISRCLSLPASFSPLYFLFLSAPSLSVTLSEPESGRRRSGGNFF